MVNVVCLLQSFNIRIIRYMTSYILIKTPHVPIVINVDIILSGVAGVVDDAVSIGNVALYLTAGTALLLALVCIVVIVICGVQMMRYRRTG